MEKNKINICSAAAGAGKAAAGFFDKAKKAVVNVVDQNDDGKLGVDDVAAVTDAVKAAVAESSSKWGEKLEEKRRKKEYETLRPIFEADVDTPDFALPKLIRVAEKDEKHASSEICKDSIGFVFGGKELDVITIYPEKIGDFGLKFYPDMESEIYYVDPADRDQYISLDEYFNYLRIARVSELQKIAQDLGAKFFRVTYKEQKSSSNTVSAGLRGGLRAPGKGVNLDRQHQKTEDNYSKVEIAAEMQCLGHKPVAPTLRYFQKDPQIQSLVSLRMADNAMTHQVYTLKLSTSTGIKVKDAMKIDSALSAMKANGNVTITSEAQNEDMRIFEYEIDF